MTDHRVIWHYDEDPAFSLDHLEQWNTKEKYAGNEIIHNGEKVPFTCYKVTYGDPDNYTVLGCALEEKCDKCGSWDTVDSLWGIDFYEPDDTTPIPDVGSPYELDASGLWDGNYDTLTGYAKEVADNLLAERKASRERL